MRKIDADIERRVEDRLRGTHAESSPLGQQGDVMQRFVGRVHITSLDFPGSQARSDDLPRNSFATTPPRAAKPMMMNFLKASSSAPSLANRPALAARPPATSAPSP